MFKKNFQICDWPPMNSIKVFLKTVPNCFLSPGLQCLSEDEPGRNVNPLTMGHILLIALNKHRNYITDACASARHASVLCAADGHAHAYVRGGATYTHRHRERCVGHRHSSSPISLSFSTQVLLRYKTHASDCNPCLVHVFRGGI